MCRAVRCKTCNKTTWAGCGDHVAMVRAQVPSGQWCPGHNDTGSGKAKGGWLRRLGLRS